MKHNEIVERIMQITGVIGIILIPTAIFLPMFASIFLPNDMSMYQLLIGSFALLFAMISVALGLFTSPYITKEGDETDA